MSLLPFAISFGMQPKGDKTMKKEEDKHKLSLLSKVLMVVVFFFSIILESLLAIVILLSLFFLFISFDAMTQEKRKRGKRT